jgi:hypothetical protein
MVYAVWRIGEFPIHHTAHTDARKTYHTAYTTVSLGMDPSGLKYVGQETLLSSTTLHIPYCIYNCLPENGPKKFETCRRQLELKIKN